MRPIFPVFTLCLALFPLAAVHADAPDVYAITNARVVPVSGPVLPRATVVLRDGLIAAVGPNVAAPADAKVIDGKGLTVYPGMIDALTHLGMPDAASYPAARGDAYSVPTVRAENTAQSLIQVDGTAFDARRKAGFTAALVAPNVGLFAGTSAIFSLGDGTDASAMTLKSPVAMHVSFDTNETTRNYPASLMGEIAVTRQALYDAQNAAARQIAYEKNPRGVKRPAGMRALAALRPVIEKRLLLVMHATSSQDILRCLKIAKEFGLRPIIDGGTDAYRVADALQAANAIVLLTADLPEPPRVAPGEENLSTLQGLRSRARAARTAAALAKAGVPFAFSTDGLTSPADFASNIRKMMAAGLTEDAAVAASTLTAARLLGIDKQLGSVEPGKIASLIVTDGDLFAARTRIRYEFIDGAQMDMTAPATSAAETPGGPNRIGGGRRGPRPNGGGQNPGGAPPGAAPVPTAQPSDNPNGKTDTTAAIDNLPVRTPTDPNSGKPAAPEAALADVPIFTSPLNLPPVFVLRHARVWTVGPAGIIENGDVYVKNGKIAGVGKNLQVPSGTREIDATGKNITPGMIDCHSHTAIEGGVNEGTNIVTAEVRIQDVIDADDVNIYRQIAGGTTTANLLHGSANAIGGQNQVVKWRWGKRPDELIFAQAPPGIKFALGENPKQSNNGGFGTRAPRYPQTRMGVEEIIRQKFVDARNYAAEWKKYRDGKTSIPPRRDLQLDALAEVLDGKRIVHCHSYRQDEILMLMRLAEEFNFHIATFQHGLEGYKIADEIAKHGAGVSTFSDWWAFKIEAWDAIPYNGALMNERGVVVSFNSDDSELARRLNLEAAKAEHWGGLTPEEAIKFVTINPAKQLRIDKYVGSLETGKDADLVVWSGDPLSTATVCEKTVIDGQLYFDRAYDLANREKLDVEKKRLLTAENAAPPQTPQTTPPSAPTMQSAPMATTKAAIPDGPVTAIVGATIHPVSGPDIPNGVLVMRGGKILAVGGSDTAIPNGATKVDATGRHLYPGLIDADTDMGLNEIESIRATQDAREIGTFNPDLRAEIAVNPDSEEIPVARANGVLEAVAAPSSATISGQGALLCLQGWTWEDMTMQPSLGLYVNFPTQGRPRFREMGELDDAEAGRDPADALPFQSGAYVPATARDTVALRLGQYPETAQGPVGPPPTLPNGPNTPPPGAGPGPFRRGAGLAGATPFDAEAALRPLNTFFDDARRYQTARNAESKKDVSAHDRDPKFEAMLPVLDGRMPVFIRAARERDIRAAVAWAKKQNVKMVLVGGDEADQAADVLVKNDVPVILGPVLALPPRADSPYDAAYTLPARLAQAGVRFCLSTGSAPDSRRLPWQAAMASAFGLPHDAALKAITLTSAQILGVADQTGSLEPGKDADIIVTTGDPLEISSIVTAAWADGQPVDLSSKQTRLYEKYKARPKK